MSVVSRWRMRREMRLCHEVHRRMDEIIDSEVAAGKKRQDLERHIHACLACGADADKLNELKDAVARVGQAPDPDVKSRILSLVEEIRAGRVPAAEADGD